MNDFYINVIQHGNQLLVREVVKGKRVSRRVKWQPTLYAVSYTHLTLPTNREV